MADQKLNIQIKAFDKTKKGFNSAAQGVKKLGKSLKSIGKMAGLSSVAFAGVFAVIIKQSLDATDTLAKTSEKIGTTTEALSKLRFAADQTGVSTTTMDMALQRFVRRTAEAARGMGEAKGALRELNLDAEELLDMPLDEQLIELSKAFETLPTDADKVRVAMKLFDSEGVALVNTLKAGSKEIRAMFKEAETLGIVMSASSAAGVEDANDALTRLFSVIKGVRDQITAALAPAIEKLTGVIKDKLLEQLDAVNGDFSKLAIVLRDKLLNVLTSTLVAFGDISRAVEDFANTFIDAFNRVFKFFEIAEPLTRFTNNVSDGFYGMANGISEFVKSLELVEGTTKDVEKKIKPIRTIMDDIKDAFRTASDTIPSLKENLVDVADTFQNQFTTAMTEAINGTKKTSEAFKEMASSVVASLTKMLVQYYITQPLFDLITGSIGGGGKSAGDPMLGKQPKGFEIGSSLTPRAIGGSVQAGKPYMVGERGAEMFLPSRSGSIVPNDKLYGMGSVVNQTINISTGVSQTVRAEITNLMPQIQEATKAAVADSRARGGSYSKALLGA